MVRSPSPVVCTNTYHMLGCVLVVRFVQIFTEMACMICRVDIVYERLMDHEAMKTG